MVLDVGVRRHEVRDEADDELALGRGRHTASSSRGATLSTVKDALKAEETVGTTSHETTSNFW